MHGVHIGGTAACTCLRGGAGVRNDSVEGPTAGARVLSAHGGCPDYLDDRPVENLGA
jgi:hypothetical protein